MTSPTDDNDTEHRTMDSALRTHVRKILRAIAATNAAEAAAIKKVEDDGHRIVDGGGRGGDDWEITDWRTGEILASGSGGYEEYCAVSKKLDPDGRWVHIDRINEDERDELEGYDIPPTDGIPATLAEALVFWVEDGGTPPEDVAQVAGWSTEEVVGSLRTSPSSAAG